MTVACTPSVPSSAFEVGNHHNALQWFTSLSLLLEGRSFDGNRSPLTGALDSSYEHLYTDLQRNGVCAASSPDDWGLWCFHSTLLPALWRAEDSANMFLRTGENQRDLGITTRFLAKPIHFLPLILTLTFYFLHSTNHYQFFYSSLVYYLLPPWFNSVRARIIPALLTTIFLSHRTILGTQGSLSRCVKRNIELIYENTFLNIFIFKGPILGYS